MRVVTTTGIREHDAKWLAGIRKASANVVECDCMNGRSQVLVIMHYASISLLYVTICIWRFQGTTVIKWFLFIRVTGAKSYSNTL